jgi:hypothetical protein
MVKPPLRTKSIGFKVSEEEYARLETAAQADGRTLGEWCREVILRGGSASDDPALAEIVGVRLEAQAFKRACTCFGLGRYLYYCVGTWVDLDERKRPKTVPALPAWATPDGWKRGLRPQQTVEPPIPNTLVNANPATERGPAAPSSLILQIEALAEPLGKRMYRGLLKRIARVWNPRDIQDAALQQQVLAHMQAAERGFRRVDAALDGAGPEALTHILRSLHLQSIDVVDNLQTLREIVLALETGAQGEVVKQ